jgi:hypothetical protein
MSLLFKYLGSCWFINNPSELVPSKSFMWKTVAFYLISGMIVEGLISDPADGTIEVVLRTIMAFTTIASLLVVSKQWHFMNQLFTAIFVCENFIMTLAIGFSDGDAACGISRRNLDWLGGVFGNLVHQHR